jgi:ubiquitin carboxyl-terminal hydrolase 5/13
LVSFNLRFKLTPDVPVQVPDQLNLDAFYSQGRQAGEQELDTEAAAAPGLPEFNAVALSQLEAMGFPTVRCQKALLATGNSDAELAMSWLFEHMEDPGECQLPSSTR